MWCATLVLTLYLLLSIFHFSSSLFWTSQPAFPILYTCLKLNKEITFLIQGVHFVLQK